MSGPHENAIGVPITVTVVDANDAPVNLVGATVTRLIFKKPGGSVVTKEATFVTDGSNGQLRYTTVDGDLVPHGTWQVQAYVVKAGLVDGRGDVALFDVLRNL